MAKWHSDRLVKKFGYKNETLRQLMNKILTINYDNMSRKISNQNSEQWSKALRKITPKEKKFIVPDISDILPKRSVFILKGAEQGKLICDTVRDSLTKNLRATLNTFTPKTGEARYVRRRGELAGRINPKLITEFENKITDTFKSYVKRDKISRIPPNVRNIAVTEMRSSINNMNYVYNKTLLENNPDITMKKTWIQNKSLSKEPRRGHSKVNGKTIPFNEKFNVPIFKRMRNKWYLVGYDLMDCPHAIGARPENVIGCSCELLFSAKR